MRFILHSDLNNFYASVECLYNPHIRNSAVIVTGDEKKRSGIVLSKNNIAKKLGVKTGDTVIEARGKCDNNVICVQANFNRYRLVAEMVKDIYRKYSDRVESFGIDEAWIDITGKVKNFNEAYALACQIKSRVVEELGVTVSIGVSYNKIFAKLGSDLKKPNAITLITPYNYKNIVWPLKVDALIYVGRATTAKLQKMSVTTIGELALVGKDFLKKLLGKNGEKLYEFANGLENSEVKKVSVMEKSIGNSTTCPRDLKNNKEVEAVIYILAENVVLRMRKKQLWCQEVSLFVRNNKLFSFERQKKLAYPTNLISDIAKIGLELFIKNYNWLNDIRSIGIRAGKLCSGPKQYNFFVNEDNIYKKGKLEKTVEDLRYKFGYNIIKRGNVLSDEDFVLLNPTEEKHKIHPISFF